MSERKTAEVKFRCTPTFKAGLAAQAEAEGISVSQLIENAVQAHIWAAQNKALDGTTLIENVIEALRDEVVITEDGAAEGGLLDFIATNCAPTGELTAESLEAAHRRVFETSVVPNQDDEHPAACTCRPWEFCTHKARA